MLSEEGRHYKISLQPLVLRNSEPKYVERLKGKGRGTEGEKRKAKRKRSARGILGEVPLQRQQRVSPAKGGEGRQHLDGLAGATNFVLPELLWGAPEPVAPVRECLCLCMYVCVRLQLCLNIPVAVVMRQKAKLDGCSSLSTQFATYHSQFV